MAHVTLIGNLGQFTGGITRIDGVDGASIRQVLRELAARYPDLGPHLESGIAVAVDGQIYQDDWLTEVGPDSDVQILPQIAGG